MSKNQRNVLVGVIILILAMLIYPPFQYTGEKGVITNMGYDWIYDPPGYLGRYNATATINLPVLLVQWLGVFLVGGLALYLAKDPSVPGQTKIPVEPLANENQDEDLSRHPQSTSNQASPVDVALVRGPVGVGGWLLLLIAGMMIIGPLLGAGRFASEIMMAESTYPNLKSLSEWSTYKSTLGWAFLGAAAISFWGGLRLSREKTWYAVQDAIAILWITGPGAFVALGVLAPLMIFSKDSYPDWDIVSGLLMSAIATSIWTAYLLKSSRVRNTFQRTTAGEGAIPKDKVLQLSQANARVASGMAPSKKIFFGSISLYILGFMLIVAISEFYSSQQTPPQSQATTTSQAQTSAGTPQNSQTAISFQSGIPAGTIEPTVSQAATPQSPANIIASSEKAPTLPARYVAKATAPEFLKPGQGVTVYAIAGSATAGRWARLSASEPHQWVEFVHLERAN